MWRILKYSIWTLSLRSDGIREPGGKVPSSINRVIRSAAFEGMCPGGVPSPALREYHAEVARGGPPPGVRTEARPRLAD